MEAFLRPVARFSLVALFVIVLTFSAFICTRYLVSSSMFMDFNSPHKPGLASGTVHNYPSETTQNLKSTPKIIDIPLNCSLGNQSRTCPANYYPSNYLIEHKDLSVTPASSCPSYFRWIYNDLWPWRETGITREMVMSARRTANFRLVILDGKAYVETYRKAFQTRDTFTLWGILQLLRRYPAVPSTRPHHRCSGTAATTPHLISCFQTGHSGAEINIKPWEALSKDLKEGNKRSRWTEREPYAYWKGNPAVAETRKDLLKCNVSDKQDWNARVYAQDWLQEQKQGFKQSALASQCIHRYKIYIEGSAWSVSEKYILACDSVALLIKPKYFDFFTRSLMPLKHYWPIKDDDKCRSIKYAVDWGNSHHNEAEAIGKAGSRFILDDVKMDYVYDYMFHLLSEYAKLLTYRPSVPRGAVELCSESMACPAQGLEEKFMSESLVKGPALSEPCSMPQPFDPVSLLSLLNTKYNGISQVDTWEKEYWQSHS